MFFETKYGKINAGEDKEDRKLGMFFETELYSKVVDELI